MSIFQNKDSNSTFFKFIASQQLKPVVEHAHNNYKKYRLTLSGYILEVKIILGPPVLPKLPDSPVGCRVPHSVVYYMGTPNWTVTNE